MSDNVTLPAISSVIKTQEATDSSHAQCVYDARTDVARGKFAGIQIVRKFGYHSGLGTSVVIGTPSSWQDLWAYEGLRTSPTSTFTPYAASSSASDTSACSFEYLDSNGDFQTVQVTLTGQTPVSLGVTAQELFRGWNSGATDFVGQVTCATTNSFSSGVPDNQDEVLVAIPVNDNQSQVMAYRVPMGKVAVFETLTVNLTRSNGSAGSAICAFQTRVSGKVWRTKMPFEPSTGGQLQLSLEGETLAAGGDFRIRIRDVSDTNTSMTATLIFVLVDA